MTGKFKANEHEGILIELLQEVPRRKYTSLGLYLGLKENDIDDQVYRPRIDPSDCLIKVISAWLRMSGKDHTWGILASALKKLKHDDIAEKIEKTYNLKKVVESGAHFSTLLTLLSPVEASWDQLGLALKVQLSDIQAIEGDYQRQLVDIISLWLRSNPHGATIENLLAAVKKINENLVEKLSKNKKLRALVGHNPPGTNDKKGDDLPDGDDHPDGESVMETMNLALPDIISSVVTEGTDIRGKEMGSYPMSSLPCGYCLIINNWIFKDGSKRIGSQKDAKDLKEMFHNHKFEVFSYENLKANEIIELMKQASSKNHLNCFAVVVLTHGNHEVLYGTDGEAVSIDKDIIEPFRGDKCCSLVDKPKLFIFQACRGGKLDDGVKQEGTDELPRTGQGLEAKVEVGEWTDQLKLPTEADILAAYAVPPGYQTWRNEKGSWFIQSVVAAINKFSETHDLVSILTEVNRKVAEDYESRKGEKKQISTFVSQLRYKLYLKKAYPKEEEEKRMKKKRKSTNARGNQTKQKK